MTRPSPSPHSPRWTGPQPAASTRSCDHPDCRAGGDYRAPKGRDRLQDYFWFCLDHVRAYNATWDYFRGMTQEEIERDVRRATVWDRDTVGVSPATAARQQDELRRRAWRSFAEGGDDPAAQPRGADARQRPDAERAALASLDLPPDTDFATAKSRYRDLVKRYHPDANGGSREAEERLKDINHAFHVLKSAENRAA